MPVIEKKNKEIRPARSIVLSFLLVIAIGTFLLTLPISSKSGNFTPVQHALFTATSATCVTGLWTDCYPFNDTDRRTQSCNFCYVF